MHYVYLLRSTAHPDQRYVGLTDDLKKRFKAHNSGGSIHTSKYTPWELVAYVGFANARKAREFEYYLKSGSGKAFASKRLW
jgi:predicted GIY-YIG superfamily endonuclease